tara:strand:+ start:1440 stop:1862 length:423 start_codon:yes stop_codon:yes gene_type:complete
MTPFKILVMGLPGAGKTWLSERLYKHLDCAWYNADNIREMANDWDFTLEGRLRQAARMKNLADFEKENGRAVICDFVCPTAKTREEFNADIVIWMNTIRNGKYEDTNYLFEIPKLVDYQVIRFKSDEEIEQLANEIKRAI